MVEVLIFNLVLVEERHESHHSTIPVSDFKVYILLYDLLAEALVPELSEQAQGVLKVLIELLEEPFPSDGRLIDQGVDLGGGPLQLLARCSEFSMKSEKIKKSRFDEIDSSLHL